LIHDLRKTRNIEHRVSARKLRIEVTAQVLTVKNEGDKHT
jgi:hypothetical protein